MKTYETILTLHSNPFEIAAEFDLNLRDVLVGLQKPSTLMDTRVLADPSDPYVEVRHRVRATSMQAALLMAAEAVDTACQRLSYNWPTIATKVEQV